MDMQLSPRSTVAGAFAVTTLLAFLIPTASPVNAMSLEELQVSAKKDGKLYIYTANVDAIMKVIVPAFEKEFPYVKVSWIRLPSTTVFNRFTAENDSGSCPGRSFMDCVKPALSRKAWPVSGTR